MRRERAGGALGRAVVAIVVVAALGALVAAGCGQADDSKVQSLLEKARAHHDKASEQLEGLSEFSQQWNKLVSGTLGEEDLPRLETLLTEARDKERAALEQVAEGRKALQEAAALKAGPEMEHYLDLKLQEVQEQEQLLEAELEAMDLRIEAVKGQQAGESLESLIIREKRIDTLEKESIEHARRASELNKEADEYFEDNNLGG